MQKSNSPENYYAVTCKLGHSGTGRHREITFYFRAEDAISAMSRAKKMPGVKHDSTTAILGLKQITKEQYEEHRKESSYKDFKKEGK